MAAKALGILVAGYVGYGVTITVMVWLRSASAAFQLGPPLVSGLIIGTLAGRFLGKSSLLLALPLSWAVILFGWFVKGMGIHVDTGHARAIDPTSLFGERVTMRPNYGCLVMMLVLAGLASYAGMRIWSYLATKRSGSSSS